MNLDQLTQKLLEDLLGKSLWAFRPELTVCATIIALLLVRIIAPAWRNSAFYVMLGGSAAAFYLALSPDNLGKPTEIFAGLLVYDTFAIYVRGLLLFFVLLFTLFTHLSGTPGRGSEGEFFALILGATLGMCLMVSANHMLIVFLGIEMASVPSYVLAGFLKHRRQSGEASLKYAVFGAGAAGVMLYGISLLCGALGSAHLPTMAWKLAEILRASALSEQGVVLMLGGLMVMVGLAFKLSAVPFHFWAPDVFEGAAAEVGAFLSIASKAAALALLVRLALGFGYVEPGLDTAHVWRTTAADVTSFGGIDFRDPAAPPDADAPDAFGGEGLDAEDFGEPLPEDSGDVHAYHTSLGSAASTRALAPARRYVAGLIALLAAVTCTFGNLAAYGQTNMKRLLAYSTIAHAGYMMMPVAAAVALIDGETGQTERAVASVAFYIGIYLFMNLGAFALVAFLRNKLESEEIADYAGLIRRSPGLTVCAVIMLFSLVGLPPLAGFAAKFTIFAAVYDAGLLVLLAIGVLNTVLSLFYYLRVVKVMILAPEPEDWPAPDVGLLSGPGVYCLIVTIPLLVLGVWWNGLFDWAELGASTVLF